MAIFLQVQSWLTKCHSRSPRCYPRHIGVTSSGQQRHNLPDTEVSQQLSNCRCNLFELAVETVKIELFTAIVVRLVAVVAAIIVGAAAGLVV